MFTQSEFTHAHQVVRAAAYHRAAEAEPEPEATRVSEGMLDTGQVVLTRAPLTGIMPSKFVLGFVEGIGVVLISARNLERCDAEGLSRAEPTATDR